LPRLATLLRHIRVASKQELKDRIMAAMDEFNRHPVVHTWSYKLDKAACYDSNFKIDVLVMLAHKLSEAMAAELEGRTGAM
jgi:hypothetical protein